MVRVHHLHKAIPNIHYSFLTKTYFLIIRYPYVVEKTLVLDLDETLVHSSLHFMSEADLSFEINVPEVGWRTVYVKVLA